MNLYQILGVSPGCSPHDIRAAYKTKIIEAHPDKAKGVVSQAAETIKLVKDAYATLSDPQLRAEYDKQQAKEQAQSDDIFSWIPERGCSGIISEMPLKQWTVPNVLRTDSLRVNLADLDMN